MPQIVSSFGQSFRPHRNLYKKSSVRRILAVITAILLLYFALRDVSWVAIGNAFGRANYGWVTLAVVGTISTYFVRGKRAQQSLMALGYSPTTFRCTIALMSGNIASMIIPGTGEITRCLTLKRTDNISIAHAMGAVVGERVLDMLMLLLVIGLTFLLELDRIASFFTSFSFLSRGWLTYLAIGLVIGVVLIGVLTFGRLRNRWATHPIGLKLTAVMSGLWNGFSAIKTLPNPPLFVALAFINQFLYWITTYWLLRSLPNTQDVPLTSALMVLTVSSLGGLAVPTQGGIGTYHFLVGRALVLYGFSIVESTVMATFMHAIGFGMNVVLSGISFLIIPSLIDKHNQESKPL
ncbi:lysylphosphatidylglycerol synthase transmembrane domain-containing protein [Fibrivirga algicola]|uniref:Flippase-like domain-containing protein n=1 Tax=Fibrivirga algicola TaxID=2950420 RepID=A0ABX0QIM7_9BACT|nr:lysylphosphatidylglycerol synthase transmembrane domain-containing protein [Fibrivirga algicola]NID11907.1 flippase-like domain-containing protein [Fibrivirga algicola]